MIHASVAASPYQRPRYTRALILDESAAMRHIIRVLSEAGYTDPEFTATNGGGDKGTWSFDLLIGKRPATAVVTFLGKVEVPGWNLDRKEEEGTQWSILSSL